MPSSYSLSPVILQPHCTHAEFDAVVTVLARAFVDDPFWRWLCRPEDFPVRLRRGMAAQLRHLALPGRVDHIPGAGAALWSPPGQWRLGLWQQLRFLPDFAAITGLARLPGRLRGIQHIQQLHPKRPHWYLQVLGVAPEQQGRGHARRLLAPVLALCDRDGHGAFLETCEPDNLPLYRRFGFEVIREDRVAANGPPIWLMWRPPSL
ncbi:MAG: GNAT family N-acetyltransferase [Alcanivorax sp.]|jgi:ribosomal protein S18 acetylase RimI-like enzyme|nr:GNAT family N-acetyltransferase [Alcanivorax sp.]